MAKNMALDVQKTRQLSGVTLAVLAGGEGARMGFAKSTLKVHGQPILRHLLEQLAWPGPTLLVTAPGRERPDGHEAFDAEAVDPVAGRGPLQGILSALQNSKTPLVIVMPIDMPAMTLGPLAWLVDQLSVMADVQALMVRLGTELQPLPAVFRTAAADLIRNQLEERLASVRGLAATGRVVVLPAPSSWPKRIWTNLNFPRDVERFIVESQGRGGDGME
jgi:molybdenum cofactor guanylyltransferase